MVKRFRVVSYGKPSMSKRKILLGVNIDHVATVRQARGTDYPELESIVDLVQSGGGDSITIHLREDRRHIQDRDVYTLKAAINLPMNLEIAVTNEMIGIAEQVLPKYVCLVPEKRKELTTEGGLDVVAHHQDVQQACQRLASCGIQVSLFIDPDLRQVKAAKASGAQAIELHTGAYAHVYGQSRHKALARIQAAAEYGTQIGLTVNAGHGLTVDNVSSIATIPQISELNIGHSIVARALFVGMVAAVREMRQAMDIMC